MAFRNITFQIEGQIGVITLSRGKLNPLSRGLLDDLMEALKQIESSDEIRCSVLFGNDEVFCAGADIKEMADKDFVSMFGRDGFGAEADFFLQCRKPIIAGVAGLALGGGCELAMMCDIIIAAESAQFGQPEINLGIMAGLGGTQRMTRAVGKAKSMEMHLTGRRMTAAEAESSGLVSRVVPDSQLREEVMTLADNIAELSPLSVMAVKEAVNRAEELSLREGLLHERRLFHSLFATRDKEEGISAFIEKRTAHFRGN